MTPQTIEAGIKKATRIALVKVAKHCGGDDYPLEAEQRLNAKLLQIVIGELEKMTTMYDTDKEIICGVGQEDGDVIPLEEHIKALKETKHE